MEQVPNKNGRFALIYNVIISIDSISFGLLGPILAPLLSKHGIFFQNIHSAFYQNFLYGLLIALFPLMFMISAPILGILSDSYGRKKILLFSLFIAVIAFASYAFAFMQKDLLIFIFARILAGISAGSQGVAQAAVIDVSKQKNKPILISTIAISMSMGLILGPMIATLWSEKLMWLPFVVVLACTSLCILLLCFLITSTKPSHYSAFNFKAILDRHVLRLLGLFFLFELGWSLYFQSIVLWISLKFHKQVHTLGLINSIVGIVLVLFLATLLRSAKNYLSLEKLIHFAFIFGAIFLFTLPYTHSIVLFLIFSIPVIAAVAIIYPGIISYLSDYMPSKQQGLLMGATDTLLSLSFTLTGILSSLVIYFNLHFPFMIAALFWFLGALGCLQLKRVTSCSYA